MTVKSSSSQRPAAPLAVLQITDLHLLEAEHATLLGVDTALSLAAVLDTALAECRPDALLVTGDIAHQPVEATYRRVMRMLHARYDGPILCLPGNHDVLTPMHAAGLRFAPLDLGGWQIYGLDTHEDDTLAARLTDDIRAEFEAWLDTAQGNLLIATHHPLVEVGCPWLDPDRLPDAPALLDGLVARNRSGGAGRVCGVVFGHAHQEIAARHGGVPIYGTPSTCFQFAPRTPKFRIDELGPGCRWLDLHADGTLTTRVVRADYALTIDLEDRGSH